jgi:hypothetical protein
MILCSYSEKLYSKEEITYNELDKQSFINEIKTHLRELKKIPETNNSIKSSNVIYVLINPQPGQVRGDWSVRENGKIYSNHRTKMKAIEEAKKIARKRNLTVMVQKMDGLFNKSFKPRSK